MDSLALQCRGGDHERSESIHHQAEGTYKPAVLLVRITALVCIHALISLKNARKGMNLNKLDTVLLDTGA